LQLKKKNRKENKVGRNRSVMNGKQLTEEEDEGEISNYEGISVVICANKIFNSLEVKKK